MCHSKWKKVFKWIQNASMQQLNNSNRIILAGDNRCGRCQNNTQGMLERISANSVFTKRPCLPPAQGAHNHKLPVHCPGVTAMSWVQTASVERAVGTVKRQDDGLKARWPFKQVFSHYRRLAKIVRYSVMPICLYMPNFYIFHSWCCFCCIYCI